jgi:hypothetical protein
MVLEVYFQHVIYDRGRETKIQVRHFQQSRVISGSESFVDMYARPVL